MGQTRGKIGAVVVDLSSFFWDDVVDDLYSFSFTFLFRMFFFSHP